MSMTATEPPIAIKTAAAAPLQPLLQDSTVVFRAPTQAWSRPTGEMSEHGIDGLFHGDLRVFTNLQTRVNGDEPEWISNAHTGPARRRFTGLLRHLDDELPDPYVRIDAERSVEPGELRETLTVTSHRAVPVQAELVISFRPEFATLMEVKAGNPVAAAFQVELGTGEACVQSPGAGGEFTARAPESSVSLHNGAVSFTWSITLEPHARKTVELEFHVIDHGLSLTGSPRHFEAPQLATTTAANVTTPTTPADNRLAHWLERALPDLDGLRLRIDDDENREFLAAGAPWFFTLFGRDSLWAARLLLPHDWSIAASTLRTLASMQGTTTNLETAEQPGKILHELRSRTTDVPGLKLPPLYYGTVDATPLWVCLLAEAHRAGLPTESVIDLLPNLHAALTWIIEYGDADGDGFLDYIDGTGEGLSNQGWKDSGDAIRWRDGSLAHGPIALCEVQGYAYEAAMLAAALLEELGHIGAELPVTAHDAKQWTPAELRDWASALRSRFNATFWVETPEGRYPAIGLDRDKRPIDSLTSNPAHLMGTGILDATDEVQLATLLLGDTMRSGYGLRTMSTEAGGYWPLSYHCGSVWTHDTAIAIRGLQRAGLREQAAIFSHELLRVAEAFEYRVPELHSGDPSDRFSTPVPYPASCRPQAWSAAAVITVAHALGALG